MQEKVSQVNAQLEDAIRRLGPLVQAEEGEIHAKKEQYEALVAENCELQLSTEYAEFQRRLALQQRYLALQRRYAANEAALQRLPRLDEEIAMLRRVLVQQRNESGAASRTQGNPPANATSATESVEKQRHKRFNKHSEPRSI